MKENLKVSPKYHFLFNPEEERMDGWVRKST